MMLIQSFQKVCFQLLLIPLSFKNFFYNMQPDLFICNICELLVLCAWAGFTQIPFRFQDKVENTGYIFVNLPSLEILWEENEMIQRLYKKSDENVQGTIYQEIVHDIFLRERKLKSSSGFTKYSIY